jgi:adenylate kinase
MGRRWAPGDAADRKGLHSMRLLLIGAPGSGKGTQATRIAEHFGITHISSGDLLRQHVRDNTPLGAMIRSFVEAGDLVPDAVVMDMLRKPVEAAAKAGGYVLDGFPRTVEQAETAYAVAKPLGAEVQIAIHLDVPTEVLVERMLARSRGAEDTRDVIQHRLEVFHEKTLPLIGYYANRESLVVVDGSLTVDEVTEQIVAGVTAAAAELRPN